MADEQATADWVEWLLIDGPAAGQRIREHPEVGTHTHQYYEHAKLVVTSGPVDPDVLPQGPSFATYRIGFARDLDGHIIRIGWCSGEPQPDPEQLLRWLRREPPVKVIAGTDAWAFYCNFAIRQDQTSKTIQGACLCGWRTETVPRRRAKEVLMLVDTHMEASIAAAQRWARLQPRPEQVQRAVDEQGTEDR